eukprot:Hpha_TRINITY_DN33028_c0_g1::TRINITY_DN33028_c0_g1_i1::g.158662::m.158662
MGVARLEATLVPLVEVAGGKEGLLKEVLDALGAGGAEDGAELVVGALAVYEASLHRYHALLKAILAHLGPLSFRRAVAELNAEAEGGVSAGRFAEAGSGADTDQPLRFLEGGLPAVAEPA